MTNKSKAKIPPPRLVAWELTQRCNLRCIHCRAWADDTIHEGEFSIEECYKLIDQILLVGKPMLILTGGEPLMRPDLFDIANYASNKGLLVSIGTNGTLITEEIAVQMREVPISRISVSIDFPTAELQDRFRGLDGAFEKALLGIRNARQAGVEVQINCTITKGNIPYLSDILSLSMEIGAVAFHPFLVVPTGRGSLLKDEEPSAVECERVMRWMHDKATEVGDVISFKPTCAPFYWRIVHQKAQSAGIDLPSIDTRRGCLAGTGFCFISHKGKLKGCGYLDLEAGDVREQGFAQVWENSHVFNEIRDLSKLKGRCGCCEYKVVCGGCRARAFESCGDYLESEPYCAYQPDRRDSRAEAANG